MVTQDFTSNRSKAINAMLAPFRRKLWVEAMRRDRLVEPTTGIGEGDPIWEAIDKGGGQTCDVQGVLRALHDRGFVIVDREVWYGTKFNW